MNEIAAVGQWIYSRLKDDQALAFLVGTRIFADFAPEVDPEDPQGQRPTPFPLVVFGENSSLDRVAGGGKRVLTKSRWTVKAVGEGYPRGLTGIVSRLDALLDEAPPETVTLTDLGPAGPRSYNGGPPFTVLSAEVYALAGCTRIRPISYPELRQGVRYAHVGGLYEVVVYRQG